MSDCCLMPIYPDSEQTGLCSYSLMLHASQSSSIMLTIAPWMQS